MYEIWLAANIVWEIAVAQAAWTVPLAIVFAVLVVLALVRGGSWGRGWRWAWPSGLIAAVAATAFLPALSGAAWSDLSYVVDWAMLLATAAGVGAVVAAIVWPLAALLRRRTADRTLVTARAGG